ncbi:MAG: hypothetical protein N2376_14995 [Clostridia bacterium]|nr:hypothetical protein [Clostridia bacterium]
MIADRANKNKYNVMIMVLRALLAGLILYWLLIFFGMGARADDGTKPEAATTGSIEKYHSPFVQNTGPAAITIIPSGE